jgi:hypothetical protein
VVLMPQAIPWIMAAAAADTAYESNKQTQQAKESANDAKKEAAAETAAEEQAQSDAVESSRKKAAMRYGLSKTIYSSSSGDTSAAAIQKKTLLGQ